MGLRKLSISKLLAASGVALILTAGGVPAATEDVGSGFFDHGVVAPVSSQRGVVATVDGQGRNVVLVWLLDCRGGYGLLMIDAETGKSEDFPMPFPCGGYCVFATVFSSRTKLYTQYTRHFVEFDPIKRAFTFCGKGGGKIASAFTEDDNGIIWAVCHSECEVVSFNPATRELKDYGSVNKEAWEQYPSCVAADDAGWLYIGIGDKSSQIVAFDPRSGTGKPMLPSEDRRRGSATVYRDLDGKVYGTPYGEAQDWYELYQGQARKIGGHQKRPKPINASNYGLFVRDFPDGKRIAKLDLVERTLVVGDPKTGRTKECHFDYASEGAPVMSLGASPDGTICGGTAIPPRFFSYNPKTDEFIGREAFGQWNTVASQGDRFFIGAYNHGYLMEWDPSHPWVPTVKRKADCNPVILAEAVPAILRPSHLLAHPDGKTLVLCGGTGYGHVGGGLLFWDRETSKATVVQHTDVIPNHATISLLALPDGKLLGGTACPETRRRQSEGNSELYILDMATKRVEWHEAVLPDVASYKGFCSGPNGLVYGVAHPARFFVFDPTRRKIVYQDDLGRQFGPVVVQQGARVFNVAPDKSVYMTFIKGIARVEPGTYRVTMLARAPVTIDAGGDLLGGRIYFAHGSHLYSYRLPQ